MCVITILRPGICTAACLVPGLERCWSLGVWLLLFGVGQSHFLQVIHTDIPSIVLLRSLWTHLRVCWDLKHTPLYVWLAHIFGWGIPLLFLAISLPTTGVSFRVGGTCLPNPRGAFVTWFGWLLAFACLSFIIQFSTTGFCLAVYLRSFFRHESQSLSTGTTGSSNPSSEKGVRKIGKRLAWRRVQKVLILQWRSIVLSLFVIIESIYFGTVYAAQVATAKESGKAVHTEQIYNWTMCLIRTGGEKNECLDLAKGLSLPEDTAVASFFMVSVSVLYLL
jgi:hypothetical protein